ncbi:hypothetical protein [Undibacterium sp. Xuan67W]|uniref:hypothetical protein n=1 Tax=Undibacterium sp. Xuan67W TaxID=3413057 RepID=UPI003BF385C1
MSSPPKSTSDNIQPVQNRISFSLALPKKETPKLTPFSFFSENESRSPSPIKIEPKPKIPMWIPEPKRDFPLGFKDKKEFRDVTRSVAQEHRDDKIIVRGSSVTGEKYTNPEKKFDKYSDIDLGIVSLKLRQDRSQVQENGFPTFNSKLERTSEYFSRSIKEIRPLGKKSGIKVFDRTPPGVLIERPHTPERERQEIRDETPVRKSVRDDRNWSSSRREHQEFYRDRSPSRYDDRDSERRYSKPEIRSDSRRSFRDSEDDWGRRRDSEKVRDRAIDKRDEYSRSSPRRSEKKRDYDKYELDSSHSRTSSSNRSFNELTTHNPAQRDSVQIQKKFKHDETKK